MTLSRAAVRNLKERNNEESAAVVDTKSAELPMVSGWPIL